MGRRPEAGRVPLVIPTYCGTLVERARAAVAILRGHGVMLSYFTRDGGTVKEQTYLCWRRP